MERNTTNASKNFSPICLPKLKSFEFLKKSSLWVSVVHCQNHIIWFHSSFQAHHFIWLHSLAIFTAVVHCDNKVRVLIERSGKGQKEMVLPSTMLKKLKKLAMIYWSEHNHFCTIKYFMSITKDLQISALARALLYKVDPCEYQSSGIGMHLSEVATKGKYS